MDPSPNDPLPDVSRLFAVCGWVEDFERYQALEQHLADVVVEIVPPGPVMTELSSASMRAWVTHAADHIEAIQGSGDLMLIGYSFGARLAFATASELRQRRRVVAFLGVVEHYGEFPSLNPTRWWALRVLLRHNRSRGALHAILRYGILERLNVWWCLGLAFLRRPPLGRLFHRIRFPKLGALFARPDRAAYRTVGIINQWFAPRPADFPVDLFLCDEMREKLCDDLAWWEPLCPQGLAVHRVQGAHLTIWDEDHIGPFSAAVRSILQQRTA